MHTPPLDLETAQRIGVPPAWLQALTGPATTSEQILSLWTPLAKVMPRTRLAYAAHAVKLVTVQTSTHPLSLLYCFDLGTAWTAQRGFLPAGALPPIARRFPVDLTLLYALHDGLVNVASEEDGPMPLEQWRAISDSAGGELMEILSEGGRGFGFDMSVEPVLAYRLDADSEEAPVREVKDPWAFMDEFMASWLEGKE
ncbi:MAG: hypothetical protein ABIQ52_11745 [Vicinamibacterales bacterium]